MNPVFLVIASHPQSSVDIPSHRQSSQSSLVIPCRRSHPQSFLVILSHASHPQASLVIPSHSSYYQSSLVLPIILSDLWSSQSFVVIPSHAQSCLAIPVILVIASHRQSSLVIASRPYSSLVIRVIPSGLQSFQSFLVIPSHPQSSQSSLAIHSHPQSSQSSLIIPSHPSYCQSSLVIPTIEDKRTLDCVNKPFPAIVRQDSAPKDKFSFGFGFVLSSPYLPQQFCGQKSTQFHPFCSKFNFVWGGRGGIASFSNITGRVPTFLPCIVVIPIIPSQLQSSLVIPSHPQ